MAQKYILFSNVQNISQIRFIVNGIHIILYCNILIINLIYSIMKKYKYFLLGNILHIRE